MIAKLLQVTIYFYIISFSYFFIPSTTQDSFLKVFCYMYITNYAIFQNIIILYQFEGDQNSIQKELLIIFFDYMGKVARVIF